MAISLLVPINVPFSDPLCIGLTKSLRDAKAILHQQTGKSRNKKTILCSGAAVAARRKSKLISNGFFDIFEVFKKFNEGFQVLMLLEDL